MANEPDGGCPDTFEMGLGLKQQKDFEESQRIFLEDLGVKGFNIAINRLEGAIDRFKFCRLIVVEGNFLKEQQQQFVQSLKSHDRSVVELHELFNGPVDILVFNPELPSQILLVLKEKAILGAAGEGVEAEADFPEKIARRDQLFVFFRR